MSKKKKKSGGFDIEEICINMCICECLCRADFFCLFSHNKKEQEKGGGCKCIGFF